MTNNFLVNMEHLMFTNKTLNEFNGRINNQKTHIDKYKTEAPKKKPILKEKKPYEENDTFFNIKNNDQLFWCYYIIKYGVIKYESLLNNTFEEEQREKIQLIDVIRKNKELLKKYKWKINMIEGELISKNNISIKTFLCICALNNFNISIVNETNLFSQLLDDSSENNIILKDKDSYKLSILDRVEKNKLLEEYTKKYWVIDNIEKPLLNISSYKLIDLQNIAKKIKIPIYDDNEKRYRKNELYNMIKSTF